MYYNDYNRINQEPIVTNEFLVDGQEQVLPAPRKKRTGLKITALCLVCALVGGVAGGAAFRYIPGLAERTTLYEGAHPPVAVELSNVSTDQPMSCSQVYASNVGSTVGITTELVTTNFWGQTVKGAAAGSGFVVSRDGYILTNYHVIKGASSIQVAFVDGTTYDATLVGGEEPNDIAVLKIETQGLTPVVLGDSDNLVVGEQVCAIGNPLGELTFTFTSGYVSAKDRSITMESGEIMNMLQTDTAINSGNSGGPLFNMYGQVIGITTAKYSSSSSSSASVEGIGFAIPINDVKNMVKDIIEKGYVTGKPNVGILMNDVSAEAQRYGIPAGAYVEAVLEGSCGEKAGLKAGDIITAVGDSAVTTSNQLSSAVKNYKAGDTVSFTIYRDQQLQTLEVVLDESNVERGQAMDQLQQSFQESRQQQQQQVQQPQQGYSWPFGGMFGW
ncbi:MAG: PDZ domain-containing protein [Oscillospiraceae bacterium]|jgi:serine protease Do|nr:PDZ domain-containing protein [Oscillospiraceae bacterium]